LDLGNAFQLGLVIIVLTLLLVTVLDTAGSLIGVARQAGLLDEQGRLPRLRQALLADSGAAMLGALRLAETLDRGVIVVVFPDGGDKYLTTSLWKYDSDWSI